MSESMFGRAAEILRINDRGDYTVPTQGLYPFQWNRDSCLTALGQAHIDEARAWREIETRFAHQWEDGMVPHIIFHKEDDGHFPGPDVWGTNRPVPTSGITQSAVAGFAVARLFARAKNKALAEEKARALLPKVHAWHEWFFRCRDPEGTGLVAVIHPWETGRDNSIDWDEAFERVPTEGVLPFKRRDTQHANPEHRPTQPRYERDIWLVQRFRELGWDNSKLHDASPFRLVEPGFNGILLRACADMADMADTLGETRIAEASRAHPERGAAIARRVETLANRVGYLVPSHDPADPRFDALRDWRGPVWLVVNYMIADGLRRQGQEMTADRITQSSLELIDRSGFAEYYDPIKAEPCGGGSFTWTAAMVIEFLEITGRISA